MINPGSLRQHREGPQWVGMGGIQAEVLQQPMLFEEAVQMSFIERNLRFGDARLPARFWSKVMVAPNGCWIWRAQLLSAGYAGYRPGGRKAASTGGHAVAYRALVGAIPDGLEIDHLCRVRQCVNPSHLEAVTHQVNTLRGVSKAAINARKTSCPRGHVYSGLNTEGRRICRPCLNETMRRWKARKRQHS